MKNVVIIGGGNGSAVVVNALKSFRDVCQLSAVISVSDSGGSSGVLRKEFGMLPPGDLLRAVLAMSSHEYSVLKDIFYAKRFQGRGKLDHHNLGNLFLALATHYDGNMVNALRAMEDALSAVGHVYPVTLEPSDLCVSLSDGTIVIGEHAIDRPAYDRKNKIVRAWLEPTPMIYSEAKKVIEEADAIILGPGGLYGSIIPNLLAKGMAEALRTSRARVYLVLGNSFEAHGETGPETVADAVHELQTFLPKPLDGVVFNTSSIITRYKDGDRQLYTNDTESLSCRVVQEDMGDEEGLFDPHKLGSVLQQMI